MKCDDEYEPILIENINYWIEQTPTFKKFKRFNTIIVKKQIYKINFHYNTVNELLVQVFDPDILGDGFIAQGVIEEWYKGKKLERVKLANYIYKNIMKEVLELIKKDKEVLK